MALKVKIRFVLDGKNVRERAMSAFQVRGTRDIVQNMFQEYISTTRSDFVNLLCL